MKKAGWLILVAGLIFFRFLTSLQYFHVDIWSNAAWGKWIGENGTKGFFYNNVWVYSWPTQLPLVNLLYAWAYEVSRYLMIDFLRVLNLMNKLSIQGEVYRNVVSMMNSNISSEIPFKYVYIFSIKLVPIVGDAVITFILWIKSKRNWLWPIVYQASPFSWYISAFWGQYDQLSFLFLWLAFLSLNKFRILSPLMFSISLGIKPTSAIFIPFYIYLLWERKKYWKEYMLGAAFGAGINLYWASLFSQESNVWQFIRGRLWTAVMTKAEPRVTVNSYNFWHLFLGDKAANTKDWFGILPYQIWGALGMIGANWAGIKIYKQGQSKLWACLAVVGIGSWMFGMNMLERYLFAGIMFGLIACFDHARLWKPWSILSFLFFINLYKHWWQPPIFDFLRIWHEDYGLMSQILTPLLFLGAFGYMIKKIYEKES